MQRRRPVSLIPTDLPRLSLGPTRRHLLLGMGASALMAACGGGGGDDVGGNGGGSSNPSGTIVVRDDNEFTLVDLASGDARAIAVRDDGGDGTSASRNRLFTELWDASGNGHWRVSLLDLDGDTARTHVISREDYASILLDQAALSADGSRFACGVSETVTPDSSEFVNKVLVFSSSTGELLRAVRGVRDPAFTAQGELLACGDEGGVHLVNTALDTVEELPIPETDLLAGATASPDGRYIAYQFEERIWVHDRQAGMQWKLTESTLRKVRPVWSPDGKHVACLGLGSVGEVGVVTGSLVVFIVPVAAGETVPINAGHLLRTRGDKLVSGSGSIGWSA
ncbi:hypothetical protein M8A51_01895 [Schlegelella sp. S2-27]|uniref:WD40 repeat domain-containing protein n=1 Tax=Caldimonas mangrovi TaxID=2944811 RepID=A0ABT0YHR3_9BURK|nr:hypothetical protein [Caldimonas mangrovi]MCM5678276.1 hypothetical protein [Caldimonas mangrovi]